MCVINNHNMLTDGLITSSGKADPRLRVFSINMGYLNASPSSFSTESALVYIPISPGIYSPAFLVFVKFSNLFRKNGLPGKPVIKHVVGPNAVDGTLTETTDIGFKCG